MPALHIAALIVASVMLFAHLGSYPLLQPDEGRNAEVAREMHVSGQWLVPLLEGQPYLDKPAFFFRAAALCFDWFGVSEFSARLPSAISGLLVLALTWAFARKHLGERVSALSVLVASTTPIFVAFSRLVIMDMTLAVFVVAAILAGACAEEYEDRRRTIFLVAGALASGLGTIVKGPVGFILPLLVLIVWHLLEGRRSAIRRLFGWMPMAAFWVTALPWFVALSIRCPDFPHYGLVEESLKRFSTDTMKRTQPFYFYVTVVLGLFFSWSLLLPEAAWRCLRRFRSLSRWERLSIVWCLVLPLFFSLSKSKQPGYVLTLVVPTSLLIARLFDAAMAPSQSAMASKIVQRAGLVVTCVVTIAATAAAIVYVFPGVAGSLLEAGDRFAASSLKPLAGTLAGLALLGWLAWWRRSSALFFVLFAGILPALILFNFPAFVRYAEQRSCIGLVRALDRVRADSRIVTFECMPSGLPFYLGTTLTFIDTDARELGSNYILYSLQKKRSWPEPLVERGAADAWLRRQTNAVYFVAHVRRAGDLAQFIGRDASQLDQLTGRYVGARWVPEEPRAAEAQRPPATDSGR